MYIIHISFKSGEHYSKVFLDAEAVISTITSSLEIELPDTEKRKIRDLYNGGGESDKECLYYGNEHTDWATVHRFSTRDVFMEIYRHDNFHSELVTSNDDLIEVFCGVLSGSSDITVDLLTELFNDYDVQGVKIVAT